MVSISYLVSLKVHLANLEVYLLEGKNTLALVLLILLCRCGLEGPNRLATPGRIQEKVESRGIEKAGDYDNDGSALLIREAP